MPLGRMPIPLDVTRDLMQIIHPDRSYKGELITHPPGLARDFNVDYSCRLVLHEILMWITHPAWCYWGKTYVSQSNVNLSVVS